MLRLIAKYAGGAMLIFGFMLILGTVGSMDNDAIETLEAMKRLLIGLSIFVGGFFTCAYASGTEVRNEY